MEVTEYVKVLGWERAGRKETQLVGAESAKGKSQVMEDFVEWVKVLEFRSRYPEKLLRKGVKSVFINKCYYQFSKQCVVMTVSILVTLE